MKKTSPKSNIEWKYWGEHDLLFGVAANYFDPTNIETIIASIEKVAYDSSLRSSLIRKGKERVKQFTWGRCAKETMKVYNEVV
jgi:glycosyltransferase involved in cell wall biosynthesis